MSSGKNPFLLAGLMLDHEFFGSPKVVKPQKLLELEAEALKQLNYKQEMASGKIITVDTDVEDALKYGMYGGKLLDYVEPLSVDLIEKAIAAYKDYPSMADAVKTANAKLAPGDSVFGDFKEKKSPISMKKTKTLVGPDGTPFKLELSAEEVEILVAAGFQETVPTPLSGFGKMSYGGPHNQPTYDAIVYQADGLGVSTHLLLASDCLTLLENGFKVILSAPGWKEDNITFEVGVKPKDVGGVNWLTSYLSAPQIKHLFDSGEFELAHQGSDGGFCPILPIDFSHFKDGNIYFTGKFHVHDEHCPGPLDLSALPPTEAENVSTAQFNALTASVGEAIGIKKKKKKLVAEVQTRPALHVLVYGDAGSKKSTFAATFPKPMLVFMFDPLGKDMPYCRRGDGVTAMLEHEDGYKFRSVLKGSKAIIRLEYYHNLDPEQPKAYRRFLERIAHASDLDMYKTLVFDSVTFMELAARHEAQYKTMSGSKDPRRWYAASKEALESMLMVRAAGLEQNIVVLAHVNEEKDEVHGNFAYNPAVPGKLSKGLPAGYAEFYRAYVTTKDGENTFWLQTQKNAQYNAASQLPAPDPCEPSYKALWEDYGQ